jgi:Tfp pilus assembly protein PilZ
MPIQRRHPRSPVRSPVEFTLGDPKNITFGFMTDLSQGGAFVQTAFPASPGRVVFLRVWWPGDPEERTLPGVVRWTRADGMGVQFAKLGLRETTAVREWLAGQAPRVGQTEVTAHPIAG